MLGKLFKHEFRETAKRMIPLNLILAILTAIGCILLRTSLFQQDSLIMLSVSCMILYILSIFALFVITGVYLTIRFYKTMYSSQGYLTHTLPVSTNSILNTKILVSVFWICIAAIVTVLSVFSLVRAAAGESWNSIEISSLKYAISQAFGMNYASFWFYVFAILILSCFSVVLMVFASLSIGQLFSQHRILGSIGAFIVLYMIQQIFGTASILILGLRSAAFGPAIEINTEGTAFMSELYHGIFTASLVQLVFFTVVFYIICYYLSKKKLNLE